MHKIQKKVLRRTMEVLGLTNQSLADALSLASDDGKMISPSTVNRWISNTMQFDPTLVLYLRERLKAKLLSEPIARLPSCVSIAIGGNKSGSGGSSVTALLALAAKKVGYRVAYVADPKTNPFFSKETTPSGLTWSDDFDSVDRSHFDFIFTEVPSRTFSLQLYEEETDYLRKLKNHDLMLLPCQLDRYEEVRLTANAINCIEATEGLPPWALLQFSGQLDLKYLLQFAHQYPEWHLSIISAALIHAGPFFHQITSVAMSSLTASSKICPSMSSAQ